MINKIYFQKTVKMISFSNILLLVMEKIILHAFLSMPLWDWWYGCVSWQSQLVNIFHFKIADLSAKQVTIIMFKFRTWRFLIILIDTLFLDVSKYQLWMATYVLIYLRNLTTNFVTNFLILYLRKKSLFYWHDLVGGERLNSDVLCECTFLTKSLRQLL